MGDSRMEEYKTTKQTIDDLLEIAKYETSPNLDEIKYVYTIKPFDAMKRIVAAVTLIETLSEQIKALNNCVKIMTDKNTSASDQDEEFDNVKTIIQCNDRIQKLSDRVQYMAGQISVYDRLFASVFDSGSPTHDI